ncbi:hypothetical protein C8J56DRAFT_342322 [Mycena floridula]|nr:hypothetical protein C8J56DRAFT_342322 [Mycena floridula]
MDAVNPLENCSSCGHLTAVPSTEHLSINQQFRSHFNPLYRSNARASSAVVSQVTQEIKNLEERLQVLDHEKQKLEDLITEICKAKAVTEEALHLHRAVLAPSRHLPNEILSTIVQKTIPAEGWNPFDVKALPWTLGQISSRWRTAAISCPSLWSHLHIGNGHKPSFPPSEPVLQECLHRAGLGSSLSLVFKARRSEPLWDRMVDMLIDVCEQWEELRIPFPTYPSRNDWLQPMHQVSGRLPNLKLLVWQDYDSEPVDLRKALHLKDAEVSWPYNISIPWSQLTRLTLSAIDMESFSDPDSTIDCYRILQSSTQLEELSIILRNDGVSNGRRPSAPTPVVLPSLRVLRCHLSCLDSLITPALESLDIDWEVYISDIPDLIRRSSCRLQHLRIGTLLDVADHAQTTISILELSPTLTSLSFECHYLEDRWTPVQTLHGRTNGQTLLPQLRDLTIDGLRWGSGQDSSNHGWIEMVESRRASLCPLKSLTIIVKEEFYSAIESKFSHLREQGTIIIVRSDYDATAKT